MMALDRIVAAAADALRRAFDGADQGRHPWSEQGEAAVERAVHEWHTIGTADHEGSRLELNLAE